MKIFFRYLFMRLLVPFFVCLFACAVIWIMVDLYGNIDDFLERKINVHLILYFYSLQIPNMLVQVLPAAILFSTLWTLLSLNRRSEIVAFQSGGMAPLWIFSPFFVFALIWVAILSYDLSGPAATAEVTRERVLQQVKGQSAHRNVFDTLPYVDNVNRRVWFFQSLDTGDGRTRGVMEILQRDARGHDIVKYIANQAEWTGGFWRLSGGVKELVFTPEGNLQSEKIYQELDLPDVTTPPNQLSLIVSQPDQLTLTQLSEYIATSTTTAENIAKYRTEWWYRVLDALSLLVLMLFALTQGMRTDRRTAMVGVAWAVVVLIVYTMVMSVFIAAGRFNRLPPFIAVIATPTLFGLLGLHLLAVKNGWWWQLREYYRRWKSSNGPKNLTA
ncbi:MAG: LptF/LptG family permease [Methylacidiphilales bacterium]|nr:LptF/LptG family permease [Candidatus Methylacidiphilales bacterium]